jgi:hypothetical protein
VTANRKLSERQQHFVRAYVDTLDAHAAALAAGYGARTAGRQGERLLVQRPIIEAIARHARRNAAPEGAETRAPITRAWITEELTELYTAAKTCLPAAGEEGGKAPSAASLQNLIRMLELLIKHLEAEGFGAAGENDEAQPDLSKLSRDELKQLEAILARAHDKPSSAGAGPAEPF